MRTNFSFAIGLLPTAAVWSALLLAYLSCFGACGGGFATRGDLESEVGSCEVACDHYEYCKGTRDPAREQACLTECRTIFSEDGEVDGASLRQLEELSCKQLLSFIEGTSSRPPGSSE